MRLAVIGAGFSGAVLARQLVEALPCLVEIWDERNHAGGNCHTERDPETQVMVHRYGPHIFNTNNEKVWNYVRQFGDFRPFINRVKAVTPHGVFSLPINLLTINQFFRKNFNPVEAEAFIRTLGDCQIKNPQSFEEQALSMVGKDLYEAFFKGYTIKQWGCDPRDLPASILKRLPVRFNYDDNYYQNRFQGIPAEGYTQVIHRILDHPSIRVHLHQRFSPQPPPWSEADAPRHVFYTGPLDAYFHHCHGRLGYRTVTFERVATEAEDYQGNAVINYTDIHTPWTRIHEHKHFAPWEKHLRTVVFREYSQETRPHDTPYYPKRLSADKTLLQKYRALAEAQGDSRSGPGISFLGRLATYRYMDMETVIDEALRFGEAAVLALKSSSRLPVFPNSEGAT